MWILLLAAPLFAADPVPGRPVSPEIRAEIDALLPSLGDDEYEKREAASARLRALGERHLEAPALRSELKAAIRATRDAEVQARLDEALAALPIFTVSITTEPGPNPNAPEPTIVFVLRNASDEPQIYAPVPRHEDHFFLKRYSGIVILDLQHATPEHPWGTHSHHGIAYILEDDDQQALQRGGARRLQPGEAVEEKRQLLPQLEARRIAISFVGNDAIWPGDPGVGRGVAVWWDDGYRTPGTQERLPNRGRVRPSRQIVLDIPAR